MIRINPFLPPTSTERSSASKKKSGVSKTGLFGELLSGAEAASEVSTPAPIAESSPVAALNPMLSFQEVSDDEVVIRQSIKKGRLALDALDDLRHAMLMGTVPVHQLAQLEKMVQDERQHSSDPRLNALLDEIELRAAVELAKLEMAYQNKR